MLPAISARHWGGLLFVALLWGGSYFLVEIAIVAFGPLSILSGRLLLASVVLLSFAALTHAPFSLSRREFGGLIGLGLLNNAIPMGLIIWAQTQVDSGIAAIFNATTPVFLVLLAQMLVPAERRPWGRASGVFVGFAGVALMVGPKAMDGLSGPLLAQFALLAASLSYACAGLVGRTFTHLPPPVVAACMTGTAGLITLPAALMFETPFAQMPPISSAVALVTMSVGSTALAFVVYFRLLKQIGASNVSNVTFLIPIVGLTLGMTFLGERPDWTAFVGMATIFLGLLISDGRLSAWAHGRRRAAPGPIVSDEEH